MPGLDSIYAMLATPVRTISTRKRIVEQVSESHEIDSEHQEASELPQPQAKSQSPIEDVPVFKERRSRNRSLNDKKSAGTRLLKITSDERFSTRGGSDHSQININV